MTTTQQDTADQQLKAKHRALWALGSYRSVAEDVIPALGPALVGAVGVTDGERVLDIAAGCGNASIPAAQSGADVVASDLSPVLLEQGRQAASGLPIEWVEADAEALPFDDGEFDVTLSCVGVMFAPHHQRAADELLRVTTSGGRIGLIAWTPSGFIGRMFATMKPYAPPPPPGAQPPPLWGDESHVRDLLGDGVRDVDASVRPLVVDRFETGAEFREFFKATYGPTIAVYRHIADDADKVAALDRELEALGDAAVTEDGTMEWEYLLLTATRA